MPRRTGSVSSVGRFPCGPPRASAGVFLVGMLLFVFLQGASWAADAPTQTFSWDVTALSGAAMNVGDKLPVNISVGPVAASNVRILQSSLLEATSKEPLLDGTICGSLTDCNSQINIHANTSQTLWLRTRGNPGTYTGSLTLASNEQPSGKTIASLTIYVSSFSHKLWGVVSIALGVIAAWLLTTVVRNRLNSAQMLLPVSVLRTTLDQINKAIVDAQISAPKTQGQITTLKGDLSMDSLRANGFPPNVPLPWAPGSNDMANAYQTYVQGRSNWVTDLTLIADSFKKALAYGSPSDPASGQQITACITQIDQLADGMIAPSVQDLQAKINLQLSTLQQKLAGMAGLLPHAIGGAQVALPTPGQIQMSINRFSSVAWAWILVVTILVGAHVLIFSSNGAGFGTPADYLLCFFWGAGLPSAASLLTSTAGTVSTSFGVVK